MPDTVPCALCGTPIPYWERYPRSLCGACGARARDGEGRPLRFHNETLLGSGFVAEVQDGDEWRRVDGGVCWVDGHRCEAREHRFGGIVVQLT